MAERERKREREKERKRERERRERERGREMSLVYMSQLPALCRKVIMLMYSRSDVAPDGRREDGGEVDCEVYS
jgi:hypothetical protein